MIATLALSAVEGLMLVLALAEPQTATHRVSGLFSKDREADLRETVGKIPGLELKKIDFDRGEAEFTYDVAVLLKGVKEKDRIQRLDQLLRQASHSTFGIRPPATTAWESLTAVEIAVAGLDCKGCELSAYEAVAKIDGVEWVVCSFRDGKLSARIDPAKSNREALVEALKKRQVGIR